VNSSTETGSQVGGAGEDVSKMRVPHELPSLLLDLTLYRGDTLTEPVKDRLHVAALLHGDDTGVVLLVNPDQEIFLVVVPDSTCVGPVTGHSAGGQEG